MTDSGFWVFGYGSLMWDPGFEYAERRRARLTGYRRAFKLRSVRYRGTPEAPGLVLGLDWDPNAACTGMAFRVEPPDCGAVRDYLARRELVTKSYFEVLHPIDLLEGSEPRVDAICYVLDRTHHQYAGAIDLVEQAEIIARAEGPRGRNCEYLHNTVAHLREMGVEDPDLDDLDARVRRITSG